jgi:hypothetical protein
MPVSITSLDVIPKWIHRDAGPTVSPTAVKNEITSWRTSRSISSIRAMSKPRNQTALALDLANRDFNLQPTAVLALVGPDHLHFGAGISLDHGSADLQENVEKHRVIHHGNCE